MTGNPIIFLLFAVYWDSVKVYPLDVSFTFRWHICRIKTESKFTLSVVLWRRLEFMAEK
jgi:hypothetical protein